MPKLGETRNTDEWVTGPAEVQLVRPAHRYPVADGKQVLVRKVERTNRDEDNWDEIKWQLFRREILETQDAPELEDDTEKTVPLPLSEPDRNVMGTKVPLPLAIGVAVGTAAIAGVLLKYFL